MQESRSKHTAREAAATSLEFVGIAVAAATLVGGIAVGLNGHGGSIGHVVGAAVGELIEHGAAKRHTRTAHELRVTGGSLRVRVSRDDIRMTPVLDPRALWRWDESRETTTHGIRASATASACVVCASWEWDRSLGMETGSGKRGLVGSANAAARFALASVQAQASATRELGDNGSIELRTRARAMVGAEATADAEASVTSSSVDAQLEAGAMAGAVARAEAKSGVELFGIALQNTASAEGWAGAGAKGAVEMHASKGRVNWRFGWGAALGLGGAAEWSGELDVSHARIPAQHRRLARDALRSSIAAIRPIAPMLAIPLP